MEGCPEYRLRLFLSVDLVGSTAFKSRVGDSRNSTNQRLVWVHVISHFYREFPREVTRQFKHFSGSNFLDDNSCPSVWKTVGDEIVFCCRLRDTEHLRVCIAAFVASLKQYGAHLEQLKHNLDVKASGWVAAFPVPNVTVPIAGRGNDEEFDELTGERVETDADNSPHEFDFLGKHIDAGFRIAQFARADQFAVSLELAWLISANFRDNFPFLYLGRRELKGVLSG